MCTVKPAEKVKTAAQPVHGFGISFGQVHVQVVNAALNEADQLLTTYRKANTPIELDIITNKKGINILRPGVSPYIARIQELVANDGVAVYACDRSIAKALKQEGVEIVLMPGVAKDKSARELIPERLKQGWVYIKA